VACLGLQIHAPGAGLSLGPIGFSTPVLFLCYFLALQATYRYHRRERQEYRAEEQKARIYPDISLKSAALNFGLHALIVVVTATWLPRLAGDIAAIMGWNLSMVGTVFVAAVTTAPELVVTVGALRLGAVDLALGDLLGSVMVNMAMLGIMDIMYIKGPILQAVSPQHAGTAMVTILMTSIAAAEMIYRPQKKIMRYLSLGAFLLAFLFAANIYLGAFLRMGAAP